MGTQSLNKVATVVCDEHERSDTHLAGVCHSCITKQTMEEKELALRLTGMAGSNREDMLCETSTTAKIMCTRSDEELAARKRIHKQSPQELPTRSSIVPE